MNGSAVLLCTEAELYVQTLHAFEINDIGSAKYFEMLHFIDLFPRSHRLSIGVVHGVNIIIRP